MNNIEADRYFNKAFEFEREFGFMPDIMFLSQNEFYRLMRSVAFINNDKSTVFGFKIIVVDGLLKDITPMHSDILNELCRLNINKDMPSVRFSIYSLGYSWDESPINGGCEDKPSIMRDKMIDVDIRIIEAYKKGA